MKISRILEKKGCNHSFEHKKRTGVVPAVEEPSAVTTDYVFSVISKH